MAKMRRQQRLKTKGRGGSEIQQKAPCQKVEKKFEALKKKK